MSYLDKAKTIRNQKLSEPKGVQSAKEANKANKASQTLLTPPEALRNKSDTVSRLPWQLERLLSAASSGVLSADLPGVPDVPRYTLGWGCSYLVGDRAEATRRLWQVYRAWQGVN